MIMDDSLVGLPATYAGLKDGGLVVVNSVKTPEELQIPKNAGQVAIVDATGIAEELIGRNIPNTAMLGAFEKASGLVNEEFLFAEIEKAFGAVNRQAAERAYEETKIITL